MPQSWSKDEEKQLLKEIKLGKSYNELAKIHSRSISALIMRFNKIIYENCTKYFNLVNSSCWDQQL
jgi:hypothetical protein